MQDKQNNKVRRFSSRIRRALRKQVGEQTGTPSEIYWFKSLLAPPQLPSQNAKPSEPKPERLEDYGLLYSTQFDDEFNKEDALNSEQIQSTNYNQELEITKL